MLEPTPSREAAEARVDDLLGHARHDQKHHEHREGRLSPYDVGGRSLDDPEQLAASLYHLAKDIFPANGVPPDLVSDLSVLRRLGTEFAGLAELILSRLNRANGYATG
jgi:hypothetical protein